MSKANEVARREHTRAEARIAKRRAQTNIDTMTVSELIAVLGSMPPDMPVVAGDMKYTTAATRVDIGQEDVPGIGQCVMIYTNLEVLNPEDT